MADEISILPLNGNQYNTQKSTDKNEIVSEIKDTKEVPEVNFPINFKMIEKYQRKIPSLLHKYKYSTHQKGSFCGGINIIINLIMCEDNIVIP